MWETRKILFSALLSGAGKELLYLPENPKAKFYRQNSELKSSLDNKFKDPGPALRTGEAPVSVDCGLLIATPSTCMTS